jgi:N-dimethylarginine dimethylaminohydrolase
MDDLSILSLNNLYYYTPTYHVPTWYNERHMLPKINKAVLMSDINYFGDGQAINAYMHENAPIDIPSARNEHQAIQRELETAGITVTKVAAPQSCQDGVYTANWGLVRGNKAVLSSLPEARKGEEPYAEQILQSLGKKTFKVPAGLHFSGQGDALPCGDYLFMGSGYRTDVEVHQFVADTLGYIPISLHTIPKRNWFGRPVINKASGWPDSFFYDIDLALSVLSPTLIAWCPQAFTKDSQKKIKSLTDIKKIEVSLIEAKRNFACNLISTGEVVIMSATAPQLQKAIEAEGLRVATPNIHELAKGGGYIRCSALTLD